MARSPLYTERERAALAWAEALTKLSGVAVPDEIYSEALEQFTEEELIDLTMAVITIDSITGINLSFSCNGRDL